MRDLKTHLLFSLAVSSPSSESQSSSPDIFVGSTNHSLSYPELLWRLYGFQPSSIRSAVSLMQQEGLLVSSQSGGKTQIRMTAAGREYLFSQLPEALFKKKPWDKTWRVAVFAGVRGSTTPPESYRALRLLLEAHKFGRLERGVYLSPFALSSAAKTELLRGKSMGLFVLMETKRFLIGDEKLFCSQAWNLDMLSKEYTKLGKSIHALLTLLNREKALNDMRKQQFARISSHMLSVLQKDPGLPLSLTLPQLPSLSVLGDYLKLSLFF